MLAILIWKKISQMMMFPMNFAFTGRPSESGRTDSEPLMGLMKTVQPTAARTSHRIREDLELLERLTFPRSVRQLPRRLRLRRLFLGIAHSTPCSLVGLPSLPSRFSLGGSRLRQSTPAPRHRRARQQKAARHPGLRSAPPLRNHAAHHPTKELRITAPIGIMAGIAFEKR